MQVTLDNKLYQFDFNTQIGPYYRYEITFGSSFDMDLQTLSNMTTTVRLCYAILINDNEGLDMTFDHFVRIISDQQLTDLLNYVSERFAAFTSQQSADKAEDKKEDEGKND